MAIPPPDGQGRVPVRKHRIRTYDLGHGPVKTPVPRGILSRMAGPAGLGGDISELLRLNRSPPCRRVLQTPRLRAARRQGGGRGDGRERQNKGQSSRATAPRSVDQEEEGQHRHQAGEQPPLERSAWQFDESRGWEGFPTKVVYHIYDFTQAPDQRSSVRIILTHRKK